MKLRTPVLTATIALSSILSTTTAQAQPPQCAYFVFTAQDYAFVTNKEYNQNLSELFTLTPNWTDQDICSGFEISDRAPSNLNTIGNNMMQADETTFTAYIWNTESAWRVTPLAVEPYATNGNTNSIAELPVVIATPEPQPNPTLLPAETTHHTPEPHDTEQAHAPEPATEAHDPTSNDQWTETTDYPSEPTAEHNETWTDPNEEDIHWVDASDDEHPIDENRVEPDTTHLLVETTEPTDEDQHHDDHYVDLEPTNHEDTYAHDIQHDPNEDTDADADAYAAEPEEPTPAADEPQQQVTLETAWQALEDGNYSTAALHFTRLTQEDINNIAAHDGLARARYAQGALTSAATTLEIALSITPEDFTLNANLGNILIQTHQYTKAITVLEQAIETSTSNHEQLAQVHANLALALERNGTPELAAEHYETAFNLDPVPDFKTRQFHALYASGQTTSLIPQLLTHAQNNPSTDLHLLAAQIYHTLGDHPSRDLQIDLALELAQSDAETARAITYQATTTVDTEEAIARYEQAAELNPDQWQAHYNVGILHLNNHNASAAVTHLERASMLTNTPEVHAALARAHLNNYDSSAALQYAHSALTSDQPDIQLHAATTAIHAAYQLQDHGTVSQLEPYFSGQNSPDILTLLGTSNYALGNYSTAALQLQAAYNQQPTPALKHSLALAYLAAYQATNALPLLQDLVNEAPMDGQLQHALGWAHQMTGNTIDAQLAFRRAAALGYN